MVLLQPSLGSKPIGFHPNWVGLVEKLAQTIGTMIQEVKMERGIQSRYNIFLI